MASIVSVTAAPAAQPLKRSASNPSQPIRIPVTVDRVDDDPLVEEKLRELRAAQQLEARKLEALRAELRDEFSAMRKHLDGEFTHVRSQLQHLEQVKKELSKLPRSRVPAPCCLQRLQRPQRQSGMKWLQLQKKDISSVNSWGLGVKRSLNSLALARWLDGDRMERRGEGDEVRQSPRGRLGPTRRGAHPLRHCNTSRSIAKKTKGSMRWAFSART